jgi:unsaturated chondroitin disaccharide hydrolase
LVPPWDFDAGDDAVRDSSAAAIASYGLLGLADLTGSARYREVATDTLYVLADRFVAPRHRDGLVLHATADLPHGLGVDESTIYGDYFYVRGLQRLVDSIARGPQTTSVSEPGP